LTFSARFRLDETGQVTGWPLGARALQYWLRRNSSSLHCTLASKSIRKAPRV
jgi:hypothetical protein